MRPQTSAEQPPAQPTSPIGGFFELHEPTSVGCKESILEAWVGGRRHAAFVNARSAFARLADLFPEASIWLPAFLCPDFVQPSYSGRVKFYPVDEAFQPNLRYLEAAAAGDLALLVCYFGLPASARTRTFIAERPDLLIVEDRAHALEGGSDTHATWTLYSPRKLIGVADGGLLIARDDRAPLPVATDQPEACALWEAPLRRYEDPAGSSNLVWHLANQRKEADMKGGSTKMTRLSMSIISRAALNDLVARRMKNWRRLNQSLQRWSALPSDPQAPPLGYVLRLPESTRSCLLNELHDARIFAAIHWPAIAGPVADFPRESAWTRELLTLPCDHRYDASDMDRIAQRVLEHLG